MSVVVVACLAGAGAIVLWSWALSAHPTLVARVRPYVRERAGGIESFPSLARLVGRWCQTVLEHLGSSSASIARRLRLANEVVDVRAFRLTQLTAAGLGAAAAAWASLSGALMGTLSLGWGLVLISAAALGAALGRDAWLTRKASARQRLLIAQLPDAAELLALALSAGESISDALARVARVADAPVGEELARIGALTRTGTPLARALAEVAQANDCPGLTRLTAVTAQALHRGTPLARVLRDQAIDEREAARRDLMERAGKQEIAMLVPVVFLIMPLTVVFALYPGLLALKFGV